MKGLPGAAPAFFSPREPIGSMSIPPDAGQPLATEQWVAAHHTARLQLLDQRASQGHWIGELSSSPLSTATAISALVLAEQHGGGGSLPEALEGNTQFTDAIYQGDLSEFIIESMHWLARQQNEDGGWGDTDRSLSNISTTMLVQAAFHLTGVPAKYADLLGRANAYVEAQGGIAGLRKQYGSDKTFAVPILANCALAEMVPWRKVPALPFELACLPRHWHSRLNLSVVSYAIPALVAIGQARHHHSPSRNPIMRAIRHLCRQRSLEVLEAMQPESGGFLEATPLTAFVVMSLSSIGLAEHRVVRRGVEFLLSSVRGDGSWPIDTNLSTWNTSQAVVALGWDFRKAEPETEQQTQQSEYNEQAVEDTPAPKPVSTKRKPSDEEKQTLDWLLACQLMKPHPFTGAEPGGWPWTDRSGGVPDADDTAAALLALAQWRRTFAVTKKEAIEKAAHDGIRWLLDLQNADGGWPTFCKGWGKLPFDQSSNDITAHALRAMHRWKGLLKLEKTDTVLSETVGSAIQHGLQFLGQQQRPDGSWLPLWFGNQYHPEQLNPVYGTAKVLLMYGELKMCDAEPAQHGLQWLVGVQHADGGWGPVMPRGPGRSWRRPERTVQQSHCSVEETAVAVEAFIEFAGTEQEPVKNFTPALEKGLGWLAAAIAKGDLHEPAPIGLYFARLWYYERLYPPIFATRTLSKAAGLLSRLP